MIDTSKTVGTPETFDPQKIKDLADKGIIRSIPNLEKAIFALEYLGQLQEQGLDLIFKGGSAIQILLGDRWNRLSVDIDICTDASEEDLESILGKIHRKFNGKTFSYNPRKRDIDGTIAFFLYRIDLPAITRRNRTILLDAIGVKPKLATQQTPLKAFFFDSSMKVTTPTTTALLGDKLSTIGPTTIGRPLNDSRNGLEYAKHLYDIDCLQEIGFDVKECARAFREAMEIQSRVRGEDFTWDECFEDMLFTCQVASLPQQVGEQAIMRLESAKATRASSEFGILQDGLRRLRPFLVRDVGYSWDNLRTYAARTALIMKMIKNNVSENRVRQCLDVRVPTDKEEIVKLVQRIGDLSEEERWFILLDEIGNFPKILKAWHNFFLI